ncbi:asparaginase domain-containing protein [Brevibacterium luteolum]|uniref:asparaginase domain-containing protein n=1 Tax=Brevibacterium luteolum TaxID=199591 RepID=UPI00223C36BF|nr:asparaginase domain-containing protein [Brevibacterium luteolum]MCT1920985.1 asparaginase domain-containing protein [Brevibacterium luteolum]
MSRLHVIALGGTIATTNSGTDSASGVTPSVSASEIAAAAGLDTLPGGAPEVTFDQVAQVGSGSITLGMLDAVVASARQARTDGARGVVLTQGTDTLADSAFVLALINDSGLPIIATGAMRNPTLPGADGPANVRAAALTALDPRLAGLPSLLVFADEIHSPLTVTKAHTTSVAAFASPAAGPLGWVSEDRVILQHMPATLPGTLTVPEAGGTESVEETSEPIPPRVTLVSVGFDDDLAYLAGLPAAGYAGAVIAGVGGGHVSTRAIDAVAALAEKMPVVLASRTGAGAVLERTYGYPGAEIDLLSRGLIPAKMLDADRARLLLILALRAGVPAEKLPEVFAAFRG